MWPGRKRGDVLSCHGSFGVNKFIVMLVISNFAYSKFTLFNICSCLGTGCP